MRLTHIAAGADRSDEGFPTAGTDDRATLRKQADESLQHDRDELAPDAIIHSIADLSVSRALLQFAHESHVEMTVTGSSPDAHAGPARIGRSGRQLLHDMPFALALAPRGSAHPQV